MYNLIHFIFIVKILIHINILQTMLKVPLPISIEVLTINNLIVVEGSTATLTTSIIGLVLDYNHYGIHEAGVQFHIVQPLAKHGKLNIESSKSSTGISISTFNMLSILKNEVMVNFRQCIIY